MSFIKKVEDFVCEKCGVLVHGNGFTNHCPKCLWGKHVDVDPGDRASDCGGMMEPVGVEMEGDVAFINYRCVLCGFERRNKTSPDDDYSKVIKISIPKEEEDIRKMVK